MQLTDYFEITSTSGHINEETFHNNEQELRCYTYNKEMAEDSFIHLIAVGSEWFWLVRQDGTPVEGKPIVEPWKCPYHNGRMCMEVMRRL